MSNEDSDGIKDNLNFLGNYRWTNADSATDCSLRSRAAVLQARQYEAPRNEVEAVVARILASLLKLDRVGAQDNFILLGGESLLAAQAAWQIGNHFGCEVSLRSILAGTVANIAAEVLAANGNPKTEASASPI
jgi:acyl carrier protein